MEASLTRDLEWLRGHAQEKRRMRNLVEDYERILHRYRIEEARLAHELAIEEMSKEHEIKMAGLKARLEQTRLKRPGMLEASKAGDWPKLKIAGICTYVLFCVFLDLILFPLLG